MTNIDRADFDALSFDVLGTILNWEPEISQYLRELAVSAGKQLSESELLSAYDRIRQPLQQQRPALRYHDVLKQTLSELAQEFEIPVSSQCLADFAGLVAQHKPFSDSVDALNSFRDMGFKLAALSNIDDDTFAAVTAAAGIEFDVVVTAQRVGSYKPDPAHFWAALADLNAMGIGKSRVLHVAQSRRADIVTANAIGLRSVWVNRPGHLFGRLGQGVETAVPDFEVSDLAELAELISK